MAVDQSSFRATKKAQQLQAVTATDGDHLATKCNQSDVATPSIWMRLARRKPRFTRTRTKAQPTRPRRRSRGKSIHRRKYHEDPKKLGAKRAIKVILATLGDEIAALAPLVLMFAHSGSLMINRTLRIPKL